MLLWARSKELTTCRVERNHAAQYGAAEPRSLRQEIRKKIPARRSFSASAQPQSSCITHPCIISSSAKYALMPVMVRVSQGGCALCHCGGWAPKLSPERALPAPGKEERTWCVTQYGLDG